MNYNESKEIYKRISNIGMQISHACEVGVYLPKTSNVIDFIHNDATEKITLVEPNPRIVKEIKKEFEGIEKVQLHPVAIHEYNGTLSLFEVEASTFADGLPASPATINDQFKKKDLKKIETRCQLFSEIDSKDIDLLSIDTEGCEWYVLKTMTSRPKVISIETHGKFYVNPYLGKIKKWIQTNGYQPWYKTRSDTVYIKSNLSKRSFGDVLELFFMDLWIILRRAKKVFYFKRYFK